MANQENTCSGTRDGRGGGEPASLAPGPQRGLRSRFRAAAPLSMRALALGLVLVLVLGLVMPLGPVSAQIVPTPDPGRDCQTVRTCNFSRTGAVRGCLSSYTCRICRTVRAPCSVGERRRVCERVVCSWGG